MSKVEEMYEANNQTANKYHDSDYVVSSTPNAGNADHNNIFAFESTVGLNVGMSGDTSDSTDDDNSSVDIDKPCGLVGLQNIGNTCYMNAALQALSNTLPLTNFFLECSAAVLLLSEGRKPGLSRTYQTLIKDIWIKRKYGYLNPSGILYGIRNVHAMFRGYHQHDTQEFLRNFMDQLHEELKHLCPLELMDDVDLHNLTLDQASMNSSFESSEGEYETCDSGVSERSSLSDETDRSATQANRRLTSKYHRLRSCFDNPTVDTQPSSSTSYNSSVKKQIKYKSIISDIFDGKLLSSVQCLTCSRISSCIETFQDLSLPIPSRDHLAVLHGRNMDMEDTACSETVLPTQNSWLSWIISWLRSWFYGPTVSLHDCLAAFFSTDELKGDNMYSCERCNKLRNGIKFSKVLQLPEVLCIHLKRFRHELMYSSKISSFVSFPLKGLDVRPYLHSDCTSKVTSYELYSVICHHGTAVGGHYTCFALNGNQWYEFDDQYVTKVSAETVQAAEAYVLFYRKNTTAAQAVKSKAVEISEMSIDSPDKTVYISKQWLSRFKTCAEPGPIDNSDFLCHHGLVHPERSTALPQLAVVLPKQLYDYLQKKFGGCYAVTDLRICQVCQALLKQITFELDTFLKLNREFITHKLQSAYLLSASWFDQWHNFVQRNTFDRPGQIDNSRVLPGGGTNDYIEVSEDIWFFFYNIYGGGPEMPIFQNKISYRIDSETDLSNNVENSTVQVCEAGDMCSCKRQISKSNKCQQNSNVQCREEGGLESCNFVEELDNSSMNENNITHSPNMSSRSSLSTTDEEITQTDFTYPEQNKIVSKGAKEKPCYKTKRRRFRCKIGYKNKQLNNKNFKQKSVC